MAVVGFDVIVNLANDLSEDQDQTNQRHGKNIKKFLTEKAKLVYDVRKTIRSLRAAADEVDHIQWNGDLARATSSGFGAIGGALTVGAGIATFMTAGVAAPLFVVGAALGIGGGAANLIGNFYEAHCRSKEIEEAEKDWQHTLDVLKKFIDNIEDMRNGGEGSLLRRIFQCLDLNPSLKLMLSPGCFCTYDAIKEAALKVAKESADDVANAGKGVFMKISAETLGTLMICFSAAFAIWDTVKMTTSIKDVVYKRRSGAARDLREKANYLEHLLPLLE